MPRPVLINYWPHDAQKKFHMAEQRVKAAVCGARSGKTLSASAEFISNCITQPGYTERDKMLGAPYTTCIGAPTYAMIERVILPTFLSLVPPELKLGKFHGQQRLQRIQGQKTESWVYFISGSNPEAWQGQDLYGAWLDEFAIMKEMMYDECQTRVSNKRGWILLTGTPKGPNWAKKRIFDFSKEDEGKDIVFFTSWKTIDNPYFPAEEITAKKKAMPEKFFKRMYEASWDTFEGQIYDEYDESIHLKSTEEHRFKLPSRRVVGTGENEVILDFVVAGVDWGYTHPGAIVVCGRDDDGRWWVLDESWESEILVESRTPMQDSWVRRARELQSHWEIERFYCGPDRPENIHIFVKAGLPVRGASNAVWEGIQVVAKFVHVDKREKMAKLFVLDTVKQVQEEIVFYHWKEGTQEVNKEEPEKIDDDTMDALRYAIYSHELHGMFRREPHFDIA